MRLFFAIEFNEKLKEYLFGIQQDIKQYCIGGNFTAKDNFHLTLRFIGEQSPIQEQQLINAMKATANDFKPEKLYSNVAEIDRVDNEAHLTGFQLRLNQLGKFDKGNKKIIWVGLQKSHELQLLYDKLQSNLLNYGYAKEDRDYSPHITLARQTKIDELSKLVNTIQLDALPINVNSISLMESKRIDNKLCYVPLTRVQF